MANILRRAFPAFPVAQLGPNPVNGRKAVPGGAPVAFSAQVAGLQQGKVAMLNAQTLQSGFRAAYFIDEIRINAFTSVYTTSGLASNLYSGLSKLISAKFDTGKFAFSKNAVPIGMYAPYFSTCEFGVIAAGGTSALTGSVRGFCNVRWPLPKPLFMPAGDVVQAYVEFASGSLFGGELTATVQVTYIGRLVAPGFNANKRQIPWVSYMQTDALDGSAAGATFKSSSREFENPFSTDLHVQRFTGRTYAVSSAINQNFAIERPYTNQLFSTSEPYFEVRIDDSLGYQIVPDFVPVGNVFDTSRHAWTFGRALAARQQFNVQVRTGLSGTVIPGSYTLSQLIGFVGYREENN